jgi:sec-independent protein translocase protein TatA
MPFNIGPFELLIVLVLALLILGPGKLPEVGNALGKTIREFRKASSDVEDAVRIEPAAAPATAKSVNTIADTTDTAAEDRTAS